jgi:(R,R)-butanediol dehydrogenase/meso-butanediol dehydrogenase/diacetyl reductase
MLMAIAAGAAAVVVAEPLAGRRARALELGATEAFEPDDIDLRDRVRAATAGVGADVAFECSGRPEALAVAMSGVRVGGRVVVVGFGSGALKLEPRRIMASEFELLGARGSRNDVARVVALLAAGRVRASALLTTRFPLAAAPEAFATLATAPGEHLKTLVEVGGESSGN